MASGLVKSLKQPAVLAEAMKHEPNQPATHHRRPWPSARTRTRTISAADRRLTPTAKPVLKRQDKPEIIVYKKPPKSTQTMWPLERRHTIDKIY